MVDSAVFHTVLGRKCVSVSERKPVVFSVGLCLCRYKTVAEHRTLKHFLCIRGAHTVLTFQNQSIPLCY